jgi:hypothetical protein
LAKAGRMRGSGCLRRERYLRKLSTSGEPHPSATRTPSPLKGRGLALRGARRPGTTMLRRGSAPPPAAHEHDVRRCAAGGRALQPSGELDGGKCVCVPFLVGRCWPPCQ